jgi:hypothetical protein
MSTPPAPGSISAQEDTIFLKKTNKKYRLIFIYQLFLFAECELIHTQSCYEAILGEKRLLAHHLYQTNSPFFTEFMKNAS